jgi:hypothetical protein
MLQQVVIAHSAPHQAARYLHVAPISDTHHNYTLILEHNYTLSRTTLLEGIL